MFKNMIGKFLKHIIFTMFFALVLLLVIYIPEVGEFFQKAFSKIKIIKEFLDNLK